VSDFTRLKEGERFAFLGLKLNASPDSLPPGKYPVATNIRAYSDHSIRTRPGLGLLTTTSGAFANITDLRAYTALLTDSLPRILARDVSDKVWLDTGVSVGTLAGGGVAPGAAMIPFRPNASPTPYMYVANGFDYQKFSAPDGSNVVNMLKVGIAEPQTPPEAAIATALVNSPGSPSYVAAGTAGATSNTTRITDTAGAVLTDPASGVGGGDVIYSVQVNASVAYQRLMYVSIGTHNALVLDVFPTLSAPLALSGIYYFSGTTGRCILAINSLTGQSGNESIYNPLFLTSLRRGAILKIASEYVLVRSVSQGPDGSFAVETSTINTHTTADTINIAPAIQVEMFGFTPSPGDAIGDSVPPRTYTVTAGIGTETANTGLIYPFINPSKLIFQESDYISMGFRVDVPENVNEFKILFDVDDGTFTKNFYYYTVRASDIASAIANAVTQLAIAQTVTQRALVDEENAISSGNQGTTFSGAQAATGANQWGQIVFSISELTRVGSDKTKSLLTFTALQVLWNVSGNVTVGMDAFFTVFGGFQPDVGDIGSPYLYRVRPRSKVTGAVGNPSPATRYGVNPRRQSVVLQLPSAAYDAQIDTWDIERYGGTITSWRYVGSAPSSASTFIDNYTDDAVGAGDALEFDNFEPWPVVDVPNNGTASIVNGTVAIISSADTDTANYLPGTLVQLGGLNVYTLRMRPVLISGTTYLLEFLENAGVGASVPYNIQEPLIANQKLPYMWGPDVNGTVFAVGDTLNPGKFYFAKNNAPDSAPDKYNIEITQPSEPLLGGEVVDGLSFVGSTKRWWALYPTPDNPLQRYNYVEQPIPRGLVAPYGHCTDGKEVFFWARDGVWGTSRGSLTDADLFNLFPHEGLTVGEDVTYKGITYIAPDYSKVTKFRLTHHNGYLYAIYIGFTDGLYHTLVLDLKRMAWSEDLWGNGGSAATVFISAAYSIEQAPESAGAINQALLFAGRSGGLSSKGTIYTQVDHTNDPGALIQGLLAVREFDGGDVRAPKQWGDFFLDCVPAATAGVVATPMSLGAQAAAPTTIPSGATRVRVPVSVGGTVVSDFLGLFLQWTDDFSLRTTPTQFFIWQPSFDVQPARTIGWTTFGTSFGLQGFGHIRQIAITWVSTATITLTITTFDGQSPQAITIPSSGGVQKKQLFPLTANKGQLFIVAAASSAPFQIFEDDIEVHVGAWSRSGPYQIFKSFGGSPDAQSPI
jgi:hypothetical protein